MTRQAHSLQPRCLPAAPWLVVAGAKGGVGKTVLAINLALLLSRAGYRTLLVDFDPGCGNVAVHLRLAARHDLEDVAMARCSLAEALVDGPAGLRLLLGSSGSTLLTGSDPELLHGVLDAIGNAAHEYDVVICDTGAGLGATTLAVAARAQLLLGVTTSDPASLTDAYALAKVLHQRGQPLPKLVVNRVKSREEAMQAAARLTAVARKFLHTESAICGWVANDPSIERSVRDQRPLALFGEGPGLDDMQSLCAAALAALPPLRRRQPAGNTPPRTLRLRPAAV